MKRPSFQFYPGDWLRDTALRTCSTGARGLWIDMICFMHEGTPYGYLKVNNKVILPANLSRMCGLTLSDVEGYLFELKEAGVYDIDDYGVICSKRMIRDENIRESRACGGKLGGNPKLKVSQKVENKVNQKPTPSSSSSSSSSSSNINTEDGFALFWSTFPNTKRKGAKSKCLEIWIKKKYHLDKQKIQNHLESMCGSVDWQKNEGQFVPAPLVYLNGCSWDGAEIESTTQVADWMKGAI